MVGETMEATAILHGTHHFPLQERVVYGKPATEAISAEVTALGFNRVYVMSTRSLSGDDGLATRIAAGLGPSCTGLYGGITAHSPREAVIEGAAHARAANAQLLIAVGGGSVIDATKAMLLCLWHGLTTTDAMDPYRRRGAKASHLDQSRHPPGMERAIRMIAVPTTYSAAEFTDAAGITNKARGGKEGFDHPLFIPQTVVLDPAATLNTPPELLLSTGVKALDHAVERFCTPNAHPYSDATASEAIRLVAHALPGIKVRPGDPEPRLEGQIGMWMSISGAAQGIGIGASHGVGHILGGRFRIPHGITSCVMLPAVLRWNAAVNSERQQRISALMDAPDRAASDLVRDLVASLGLPTRLRDIGIKRDDFRAIAEHSMHDPAIPANPRKIAGPHDIVEILELAW